MERAEAQGTTASAVVNILLETFNAGELDEVVARGLASGQFPVPGAGGGQNGQHTGRAGAGAGDTG